MKWSHSLLCCHIPGDSEECSVNSPQPSNKPNPLIVSTGVLSKRRATEENNDAPFELCMNLTDSELVVVEDTSDRDSNAVILKLTAILTYKPSSTDKPLQCNIQSLEVCDSSLSCINDSNNYRCFPYYFARCKKSHIRKCRFCAAYLCFAANSQHLTDAHRWFYFVTADVNDEVVTLWQFLTICARVSRCSRARCLPRMRRRSQSLTRWVLTLSSTTQRSRRAASSVWTLAPSRPS